MMGKRERYVDLGRLRTVRDADYDMKIRNLVALPQEVEVKLAMARESVWMRLGATRAVMNENEAAVSAYKTVLIHNPNHSKAATEIGSIFAKAKDYPEAEKFLQKATTLDPENGKAWGILGHCYVMTENLQSAYEAYCKALTHLKEVSDPALWYGIGLLHDRLGSLDLALEAFLEVLKIDKDFQRADELLFCIGIIYKEKQNYPLALEYLNRVASMELPPQPLSRADTLFLVGHVHELQGDLEKAMEAYQLSLRVNSQNDKVLQQFAWLTHKSGRSEEALQIIEKSFEVGQRDAQGTLVNAQGYYINARIHIDRKDIQAAYSALSQAITIDSQNPFYWCTIGVLYGEMMQYKDAMDAYTRAIRINPYVFEVWYNLGSLYQACNQPEDSIDAFERALGISPENRAALRALEVVRRSTGNSGAKENEAPSHLLPPTNPYAPVLSAPQQKQQANQHAQFIAQGMDLGALARRAKARRNTSGDREDTYRVDKLGDTFIAADPSKMDRWALNSAVTLESRRDLR